MYLIDEDAGPGLHAASSKEAQRKFDSSHVVPPGYEAITQEEAGFLVDATDHLHFPYVSVTCDSYYTIREITGDAKEMCPSRAPAAHRY